MGCLGLLLSVLVTPAATTDRDAATAMLPALRKGFRKLRLVWADSGCTGHLVDWAARTLGLTLEVVKHSDDLRGFRVLPRRWVVERSLAWLMRSRRLARDYEAHTPAARR
ncbi:transposase [Streptomyces incanus]|uniref:Transposase n=1 Tax=Streptomyces incanus TaxID=887453 RepID=A0ABW0XZA9_9ACTN